MPSACHQMRISPFATLFQSADRFFSPECEILCLVRKGRCQLRIQNILIPPNDLAGYCED